jgi:geranylgeranyl pyrophosphate synthase
VTAYGRWDNCGVITSEELALVEAALREAITSNVSLLSRAAEHIILSGGKRLRPRLALLAYKAVGGEDIACVVPLAAALELVHTASLVHDDITDGSDLRRGQRTVNARWGHSVALLTGDFIFIRLLKLMATFDPRIVRGIAECCQALVEGEAQQVLSLGNYQIGEEAYLKIVAKKTGALFSACTEMAGILAGGSPDEVVALREYGLHLGTAFQIRDDTLDLTSTTEELGKPVASDLRQGKMSLAPLFALQRSERAAEVLFAPDLAQAVQLLRGVGAIDYAMQIAAEYAMAAKQFLRTLPPGEATAALADLADFAIARAQ